MNRPLPGFQQGMHVVHDNVPPIARFSPLIHESLWPLLDKLYIRQTPSQYHYPAVPECQLRVLVTVHAHCHQDTIENELPAPK